MSARHDDPPWMRPPTTAEFLLGALSIQDDVSWYNFRDAAVRQGYSDFEADYQEMCTNFGFEEDGAVEGKSPMRVHNVGPNNQWGYPAGIECTFGLVWSGHLLQPQIEALNRCVPLEVVLVAGGVFKETLKQVAEKVKP